MLFHTQLPYISTALTDELVSLLTQIIRLRSIGAIVGPSGVGKSRTVDELIATERCGVGWQHAVVIELARVHKSTLQQAVVASPMGLVAISLLHQALLDRNPLRSGKQAVRTKVKQSRIYSDNGFLDAVDAIQTALTKMPVVLLVVDNAQLLDDVAFEWLYKICQEAVPQLALLLLAHKTRQQAAGEPLRHLIRAFPHLTWAPQCAVTYITEEQARAEILADLFTHLQVDLDSLDTIDAAKFEDDLWAQTSGDWYGLTRLGLLLDTELGPFTGQPRAITQATVDRVFAQLRPLPLPEAQPASTTG